MPRTRRFLRRFTSIAALVVLVAVVLAAAAALWATHTAAGRAWLTHQMDALAGPAVRIDGLGPGLPGRLQVRRIALRDADGAWLTARGVHLAWRPWALFTGRLAVTSARARRITVHRPPAAATAPAEADPAPADYPDPAWLARLGVGHLMVDRLRLRPPILGEEASLTVQGALQARSGDSLARATLVVARIDGTPGTVAVRAGLERDGSATLDLHAAEPEGGILAKLLNLPGKPPLRLAVTGQGTPTRFAAGIEGHAPGLLRLDGNAELRGDGLRLALTALPEAGTPAAWRAVTGDALGLTAEATLAPHPAVRALTVATDAWTVTGNAALEADERLSGRFDLDLRRAAALRPLLPPVLDSARATVRLSGTPARPAGGVDARVDGVLHGLRPDGVPAGLLPDPLPVHARGRLADGTLHLRRFAAGTAARAVSGAGRVDPATGRADGRVTARLADAALLRPVMGKGVPLPEGPVRLAARGTRNADGRLRLAGLHAMAAGATLTAHGTAHPAADTVNATARLDVPALGRLHDAVAGRARAAVTARGALTDPTLRWRLDAPRLRAEGNTFRNVQAQGNTRHPAAAPAGHLLLLADTPAGPAAVDTDYAYRGGRLRLRRLAGTLGPAEVSGDLAVDPAGPALPKGRLAVTVPRLKALSPALTGRARADVRLSAPGGRQAAHVTARAPGLGAGPATITGARLEARAADLLDTPRLTARLTADSIGAQGRAWHDAALTAEGSPDALRLALAADGSVPVRAGGRLNATDRALRLARFTAGRDPVAVALAHPATLRLTADGPALADLALHVNDGRLTAAVRRTGKGWRGQARLHDLGLGAFAALVPEHRPTGRIAGRVRLDGRTGRARLTATDISFPEEGLPPLDAVVAARLAGPRLNVYGALTGTGDTPGRFSARLPVIWPGPRPDPDGAIQAHAAWAGPLALVDALLPGDAHRLRGTIGLDAKAGGTLAAPGASGRVTLRDGVYEHLRYGTLLRDLKGHVAVASDGGLDARVTGTDGGSGRLNLTAKGTVRPDAAPRLDARLTLDSLHLVRMDVVTGQASGTLTYKGKPPAGALEGTLRPGPVEARLAALPGGGVPHIKTVRAGSAEARALERAGAPDPPAAPMTLDVAVKAPRRLFLRGEGVDSEWSADLQVRGTAARPAVHGTVRLVRGRLDVAGQRFSLDKGVITLDGRRPPDPELDVQATHEAKELTAIVNVTGRASKPDVRLTSRPEMPEGEVASQLLFGKAMAGLSPGEALQAARLAGRLTGVTGGGDGGALDIMGRVRSAAGLDVLDVSAGGGDSGPGIEAGKYVAPDLYLGVEGGAASGAVTVEYDLTPSLTLETRTQEDASGNIGLTWHEDY